MLCFFKKNKYIVLGIFLSYRKMLSISILPYNKTLQKTQLYFLLSIFPSILLEHPRVGPCLTTPQKLQSHCWIQSSMLSPHLSWGPAVLDTLGHTSLEIPSSHLHCALQVFLLPPKPPLPASSTWFFLSIPITDTWTSPWLSPLTIFLIQWTLPWLSDRVLRF